MKTEPINSEAYWDQRFSTDWEENQGPAQTRFFASLALGHLPPWLESDIRIHGLSIVDFGCATGEALPLISRHLGVSVSGVDVSLQALLRARQRFPEHQFHHVHEATLPEDTDVLFTSNTLEHFQDPFATLSQLLPRVRKYAVLLLPFQEPESERLDEHFVSFDFDSIPLGLQDFRLLAYRVFDTSALADSLWDGKQILLVYARTSTVALDSHFLTNTTQNDPRASSTSLAVVQDELDRTRLDNERLTAALQTSKADIESNQRLIADQEYEIFAERRRAAELDARLTAATHSLQLAQSLLEEFRVSTRHKLSQIVHSARFRPAQTAMSAARWVAGSYRREGLGLVGGLKPDDAIAPIAQELQKVFKAIQPQPPSAVTRETRPLTPGERGISMPLSPQRARFVSVVLPVFNQADLLEDSIESVLNQTWKELELIIVNDGSTDGVERVLEKYLDDPRVIVLSGPNQKLPNALNSGFARATGEYWTWTSADNLMLPTMLETLVSSLIEHQNWAMVYSDYQAIDDAGRPLNDPRFRPQNQDRNNPSLMKLPDAVTEQNFHESGDNFLGASFLYRRSAATAVGHYASDTFGGEDYDFWLRIHTLFDIGHVPQVLYKYRVHDNTLNARAEKLGLYDNIRRLLDRDHQRRMAMRQSMGFRQLGVDFPLPSSGTTRGVVFAYSSRKLQAVKRALSEAHALSVCVVDVPVGSIDPGQLKTCDLLITTDERAWEAIENWLPGRVLLLDISTHPELFVELARYRAFERKSEPTALALEPLVTRRLHVALQARSMDKGGLEQVIVTLAQSFDRTRFDVTVLVEAPTPGELGKSLLAQGIRVIPLGNDLAELERVIQRFGIDVVNFHYSLFGLDLYRRLRIPTIYTLHNSYTWLSAGDEEPRRDAYRVIPRMIAVSREVARYAVNRFGVAPSKMRVVPNGISDDHFPPAASWSRKDLGLAESDYVFVNLASVSSVKAQHVLLTAIRELKIQHPHVKLLIAGGVHDADLYSELQRRVRDEGLAAHVHFLGHLGRDRVAALLGLANAFILPSVHEGWSIALMEAMSRGLPVITTDTGSAQDLIPLAQNGIVVPNAYPQLETLRPGELHRIGVDPRPDHFEHIKRAMLEFVLHPEKWAERGVAGREVLKNFGVSTQARAYEQEFIRAWGIYRKQLAPPPPPADTAQTRTKSRRLASAWLESAQAAVSDTWRQAAEATDRVALNQLLRWHGDGPIMVFPPVIDWAVPIFQRPQHLALQLGRQGIPYFFCTPNSRFDKVSGFRRIGPSCYLTNRYDLLVEAHHKKIFHLLSTDMNYGSPDLPRSSRFVEQELARGNRVLYEYIDEIHPAISGTAIPPEIFERHRLLLSDERVTVVATASTLFDEVAAVRKTNFGLVSNGVDFDHFSKPRAAEPPSVLRDLVASGKPIIGYFGALADWFDYELTIKMAEQRNWNVLLIGFDYDGSMQRHGFPARRNPRVIGPIPYKDLPEYAAWFDVATIPFKVNPITASTSPIKLFEYMALGKPIVTTEMPECRKYRSVLVGASHEEFINLVDRALLLSNDPAHQGLLRTEALANVWASKAEAITQLLAHAGAIPVQARS